MTANFLKLTLSGIFLAMCVASAAVYAHDDDDDEDEHRHQQHAQREHSKSENDRHSSAVSSAKLQEECGSCHIVYPPNLLPAESWRALMGNLNKHFGTDASLDLATQKELRAELENAASSRSEGGRPVLRITQTRWFQHEHDEVSNRTWRNPKVKSASNCGACHTYAAQGKFNERDIHIPR
ncbi:MAG: diheme cytochrome c [Sideroxydans sp.]|nr:diheme cytochrome c [Sideroxydans sp.]